MHIENIVIGKPIVELWNLLGSNKDDKTFESVTAYDTEKSLAKLVVKYGFMQSNTEVRRNRMDLVRQLDKLEFTNIKIGKKKFCLIVGADSEEEYNKIIKQSEED